MAIREDATILQHKSNLRNIRGSFAADGMVISESIRRNLVLIASGQTSYQQILTELRAKYEKIGNGRSIRALIRCMGLEYGLLLNWGNDTLIDAAIASVDDDMAFCDVLTQCLETEK